MMLRDLWHLLLEMSFKGGICESEFSRYRG